MGNKTTITSCEAWICLLSTSPLCISFNKLVYYNSKAINYPWFSKTGHDTMSHSWSDLFIMNTHPLSKIVASISSSLSLSLPCFVRMQMGKLLGFLLLSSTLFIGLVAADWNILNQKRKHGVGSSLKNYCESWRINVELNNIRGFEVVPQECVEYIQKYMTSSQYKADSERAVEEVTLYLTSCCSLNGDGKDAWIFDVDDTLLSTVPYFKKHGFG